MLNCCGVYNIVSQLLWMGSIDRQTVISPSFTSLTDDSLEETISHRRRRDTTRPSLYSNSRYTRRLTQANSSALRRRGDGVSLAFSHESSPD